MIPTCAGASAVRALVASLLAGTRVPDEVVVVDNCPSGGAVAAGLPPAVRVLDAGLGLNVAGARETGWRATSADLVLFIDDDNTVGPDAVAILERVAALPGVGLVAPVIFSAREQGRVWCGGIRRSMLTTHTTFLHNGDTTLPEAATWPTEDMPDAFLVPRSVLERIGGFDATRFPFHYDEADLGLRIRRGGWRALVARDAAVHHDVEAGTSAGGAPGRELLRAYERNGRSRVTALSSARIRFHRVHGRGVSKALALAVFIPTWLVVSSLSVVVSPGRTASKLGAVLGLWSGAAQGWRERS